MVAVAGGHDPGRSPGRVQGRENLLSRGTLRRIQSGAADALEESMSDQMRKAEEFKALHIPGKPLVLFNIWDAGSAKAVAAAGGKAIATGSWSVANANGFADGEHIPFALAIDNLRRIVAAPELPVTI